MKKKDFKLGDKTTDIWAGDVVTECEFICHLNHGNMLFYDTTFKCFRRVFVEPHGKNILNGWEASDRPSKFL